MRPVEFWEAALRDERDVLLVSESRSGSVAAYALLTVHDTPDIPNVVPRRLGILEDLVVHPDHRRSGHAKRLLERVDCEARSQGAASIELRVWAFNEAALKLYQSEGYTDLQRRLSKRL